ncbi:MAG TPA: N-acetylmuramoyl-L-alanine amidase [Thermomonas sp.]|nr:N-acetylmuramoyl-L-alanine amidase [Thermomonas sp.]
MLAAMLLAALCWNLANASEIKQLKVDAGATGTRAEFLLDREGAYQLIDLRNPDRLVVDFPESRIARGLALPKAAGVVKAVRTGQPAPGTVRIVFDLGSSVAVLKPRVEQSPEGPRLVLEWPGDGVADAAAKPPAAPVQPPVRDPIAEIARASANTPIPVAADKAIDQAATISELPGTVATGVPTRIATGKPQPAVPAPQVDDLPAPPPRRVAQGGMRPLVIAIDPGHGGQDPGSRGPNGAREKDVVLAIARELARQVNATPGLKAFLTRDSDVFIPLPQRARRASAAKADIFLSIHADAWTSPTAKGAGIFVLSTRGASSQRARLLADKENAADIIGGEQVHKGDRVLANVLLDLTQSGNLKASEEAASHILDKLDDFAHMHKNEVERANFAVLRTSDRMPAMLVETGFISNPGEEAKLGDPAYQRRLASAILDGVDRYFSRQPPPGTLYAARARAKEDGGVASVGAGGSP